MIQALVLDIDGVLIGEKIGYNTPEPHPEVINRLTTIRKKDIPIILCTAKPHFSIEKIIRSANLTNPHITYAGGVIIDLLQHNILASHPMPKPLVTNILSVCVSQGFYTEVYTMDDYYILKSQQNDLTRVHTHILQHEPILVDSFDDIATSHDVYKITPIVLNESGIDVVNESLKPFKSDIENTWSIHPIANPHQFSNISAKGISKRQAVTTVLTRLGIDPKNALSVGDSTSDWKFMELTGFVATLANGQDPLKQFVADKQGFIGGHVDENGILGILDHFSL